LNNECIFFQQAACVSCFLILATISQIAASAAPRLLGWEHDISNRFQSLPTPIVPLGWTF
jgi:hypothetical protein